MAPRSKKSKATKRKTAKKTASPLANQAASSVGSAAAGKAETHQAATTNPDSKTQVKTQAKKNHGQKNQANTAPSVRLTQPAPAIQTHKKRSKAAKQPASSSAQANKADTQDLWGQVAQSITPLKDQNHFMPELEAAARVARARAAHSAHHSHNFGHHDHFSSTSGDHMPPRTHAGPAYQPTSTTAEPYNVLDARRAHEEGLLKLMHLKGADGARRSADTHPVHADIAGLDRKSVRRISRGHTEIDATIDLHGMTQEQAHRLLVHTVLRMVQEDARVLLVVTGKGGKRFSQLGEISAAFRRRDEFETGTGVLRRALPRWLAEPALRPYVASLSPASAGHGGDGAWYVRLKKRSKLR